MNNVHVNMNMHKRRVGRRFDDDGRILGLLKERGQLGSAG